MSEHTKGPWTIKYNTNIVASERQVANAGVYSTNGPNELDVIAENEANARLIAAAPDLLAACEEAERVLGNMGYAEGETQADNCYRQLRAASAKARGG